MMTTFLLPRPTEGRSVYNRVARAVASAGAISATSSRSWARSRRPTRACGARITTCARFSFASYTPGYTAFLKNSRAKTRSIMTPRIGGALALRRPGDRCAGAITASSRKRSRTPGRASGSPSSIWPWIPAMTFSARTSVEADLNVITHHYNQSGLVGSSEWIDRNYLNYQVMPKTNISAGATFGYVAVDSGPDQTYEQILTRVTYDTGRAPFGQPLWRRRVPPIFRGRHGDEPGLRPGGRL